MTEKEPVLMIPPFILREAPPPPPESEEPLSKLNETDPHGGDMLNSIIPNFKKRVANLHYVSTLTGEYGTLMIRPGMSEDDIMEQYAMKFPRECYMYLQEIKLMNQTLYSENGMSKEKHMMAVTKIPELIYTAMKFIDEDYWFDIKRFYRFIRKYPKFMIGNKRRKIRGA